MTAVSDDLRKIVVALRQIRDARGIRGPSPEFQGGEAEADLFRQCLPYLTAEPLPEPFEGVGRLLGGGEVHTDDLSYFVTHYYSLNDAGRDFLRRHRRVRNKKPRGKTA